MIFFAFICLWLWEMTLSTFQTPTPTMITAPRRPTGTTAHGPRTARTLVRADGVAIFQKIDARNSRRGSAKSAEVLPGTPQSETVDFYKPDPPCSRSLLGGVGKCTSVRLPP